MLLSVSSSVRAMVEAAYTFGPFQPPSTSENVIVTRQPTDTAISLDE